MSHCVFQSQVLSKAAGHYFAAEPLSWFHVGFLRSNTLGKHVIERYTIGYCWAIDTFAKGIEPWDWNAIAHFRSEMSHWWFLAMNIFQQSTLNTICFCRNCSKIFASICEMDR